MLPKFDDVPIRMYLIVLAKMRRPFDDAVGEHAEILVEQDDVGRVLGDVGAGVDRDTDVGVVQRDRVVHPVAHERDVGAAQPLHAHDARLRVRARRARTRSWCRSRRRARSSLIASTWSPVERAEDLEPDVLAHLDRDEVAVAGDDLHRDAEPAEPRERGTGVGLGPVDEHEEPGEREVLLVGVGDRRETGRGSRAATAIDAGAAAVEVGERGRGPGGRRVAARNTPSGSPLTMTVRTPSGSSATTLVRRRS